jgi:hypothetical protein
MRRKAVTAAVAPLMALRWEARMLEAGPGWG